MNDSVAALLYLLMAVAAFIVFMSVPGCASGVRPRADLEFWAGDSASQSIQRAQESGSQISCNNPKFDDYVCLNYSDFLTLSDLIGSCKTW